MDDTDARPLARFHFDPRHDAAGAPDADEMRRWTAERLRTGGTRPHDMVASICAGEMGVSPLSRLLDRLIPGRVRRRHAAIEADCLRSAVAEMEEAREAMAEFGVDLRRHDLAPILDGIATVAAFGVNDRRGRRFAAEARARWGEGMASARELVEVLDGIDAEGRLASLRALIRARLEMEAVCSLLAEDRRDMDHARRLAALRAALDEVKQVELRDAIEAAVKRA